MQRRKRRNKKKNQRKLIILSTILLSFTLITAYSAFSTTLTLNAKGNIVDKSKTIQSWAEVDNVDFHTDFYRENIVTATFLDTAKVPENAVESWDVSVTKDRGVMAYVTESQTETGKYDLFIGAKDGVIANEDSSNLFFNFRSLRYIEFGTNYDTSNVTNMHNMFLLNTSIDNLDLSSFTTSKVTDMGGMFARCNSLTNLNLNNWDTSKVTNMYDMFAYNSNLKTIMGLEKFNTSSATTMHGLFYSCSKLEKVDVSNFNTSKVTDMSNMFAYCSEITTLDLCSFNTSNVIDLGNMFHTTSNLTKVKVGPNWITTNAGTTNMFKDSAISNVTTGEC